MYKTVQNAHSAVCVCVRVNTPSEGTTTTTSTTTTTMTTTTRTTTTTRATRSTRSTRSTGSTTTTPPPPTTTTATTATTTKKKKNNEDNKCNKNKKKKKNNYKKNNRNNKETSRTRGMLSGIGAAETGAATVYDCGSEPAADRTTAWRRRSVFVTAACAPWPAWSGMHSAVSVGAVLVWKRLVWEVQRRLCDRPVHPLSGTDTCSRACCRWSQDGRSNLSHASPGI